MEIKLIQDVFKGPTLGILLIELQKNCSIFNQV